jgi:hypothetical protein
MALDRRRSLERGIDTASHTHVFDTRLMILQGAVVRGLRS